MTIPTAPQSSAAYRSALLALQKQQRAQLATLIQQTEAALHEDWTRGPGIVAQYYAPLIDQYARALNDLRIAEDDPAAKLSLDWLTSKNESLRAIETNVKYNLDKFGNQSTDAITAAQRAAANAGLTDAGALTQEALSPAWEKGVNPAMLWSRPNPDAIGQWVGRAGNGHPLGDLFDNFSSEAASEARKAMLFGLATGANPQVIARGIQDAMGISRSRALTISRTEVLGSYRAAAHDVYRANSDVLNYWLWSAGGANPCFPAGTLISTRRGYVPIENVRVGDEVLTHQGRFQRVTETMQRVYRGPMVTVEADGGGRVTATGSHPFLVERQGQLNWIEASQLCLSDGVIREHERTAKIIDHCLSDDPVEGRVGQAHDTVAPALQEDRLASVAGSGAGMPVDAIDLQHGVERGEIEVNGIAPAVDNEFLPIFNAERFQTQPRSPFWLGLASMATVAANGAEATIRECARLCADFLTAFKAREGMCGASALLRAIMPIERTPEQLTAAGAGTRRIDVDDGAASVTGGGTMDADSGVAPLDAERLAALRADLLDAVRSGVARGGAIFPSPAAMLSEERLAAMAANAFSGGVSHLAPRGMGMPPLMLGIAGAGAKAPLTSGGVRGGNIEGGAAVLTDAFHIQSITRLAHHIQMSGPMVYNLEVAGDHTYIANGFAVHNCAMCMGMDGTLHSLDESLDDHPCGKCAPLPVTKSWADILGPLGIDASDLDETSIGAPGAYETGEEKFAKMSPERQERIIGTKTGYEAYQRGEVSLRDFVGVRPGSNGFPSSYYQRSLKELQIPTRQAARLVEPSPEIAEKLALGKLRASDLGKVTPDELMPAWAKQSGASRIVYQILRNGLPYDMTSHEYGLLITNLEQMLRGELPVNVRAAAERQLQALGQSVERQTVGQAARILADQTATDAVKAAAAREIEQTVGTAAREAEQVAIRETDAAIEAAVGQEARHIAESDVAAWTADNAPEVPSIGYHRGSFEHVERLGREGIDVTRNLQGTWGRGFYMHAEHDLTARYGPAEARVAIRMQNPFVVSDPKAWQKLVDTFAKGAPHDWDIVMNRLTDDLLAKGYDGIIIRMERFNVSPGADLDEIIAIKPGTVRVIVPGQETVDQAARILADQTATDAVKAAAAREIETVAVDPAAANAPVDLARVITRDDGSIFLRANGDKIVIDAAPDGAIRIDAEALGLPTGGQSMTADAARAFLDANHLGQLKPFVEMAQQDATRASAEDVARVAARREILDKTFGDYSDKALQQYTDDLFDRQPILLRAVEAHYRGDPDLGEFARLTPANVGRLYAQELGAQGAAQGEAALNELHEIAEWGVLHQPATLADGSIRLFRGVSDEARAGSLIQGTHGGGVSFTNDFNFAKSAGQVARVFATRETAESYLVLGARVPADEIMIFDRMLTRGSRLAQLYGWQHEYVVGEGSVFDMIFFNIEGT